MAAIVCPNCNKTNPDALDVCQFCGTPLKNRGTEPLPTIRPGEMPVKQQTSELESTLPTWLRDMRKGDGEDAAPALPPLPGTSAPVTPQPAKPETPKKKDDSPLDFLAGLSQINDDEETAPDWLASLGGNAPSKPAPAAEVQPQEPADWLAGLQADLPPQATASEQPAVDWAFKSDADKPVAQALDEETPDWLTALKAQDTRVNAPAQPKPAESSPADAFPSSGSLPDWLNDLGGGPAAPPAAAVQMPSPVDDLPSDANLPGWLSDLSHDSAAPVKPAAQPAPAAPTPPAAVPAQAAQVFPDWLADLGHEDLPSAQPSQPAPAASTPPAAVPAQAAQVLPDWLADLGKESLPSAQPSQPVPVASDDLSSGENMPEWLTGLTGEPPKVPTVAAPSIRPAADETLPAWLESAVEAKPPEKPVAPPPSAAKKAFGTGALKELAAFDQPDQVPDWMANLVPTTPAKTPEPAASAAPGADAFDWLSGLNQAGTSPAATEPKPTGQPESAVEKQAASEASAPVSGPDSGSAQSMDSIFSMEMPDWLSGFTPSEPEHAKATAEQPGISTSTDNLSPADLPSWVQAMRPIESVMSGAQSDDEDQTVEKEGPLAGLRSVLPGQVNAPGQRKPKAYSIKLQVDTTQMAQATLLENLIASEAESRPVSTLKQVFNIRPLRWMIALVLLLAVLGFAIISNGPQFFPLPASPDAEVTDFYSQVKQLPDAAAVLVVFDYQSGYAGEMEQVAGPVIDHLMIQNARLAFVSTSPMGVLMNERIMDAQNKLRTIANESTYDQGVQYVDLGYLPGDAAGIQVFAENPRILGNDYQYGDLWTVETGFDQIRTLADFKAVIVLTDNPDTGRMWIEQTDQALKGKLLLMAVSAQAAPMIRPYYKSGQVQGMVSGLAGGAAYEGATQRPGNAGVYWDAYGAGMIAAEMLIVVGGVWALVQHLRMRRAEQNQEEDEA